MKKFRRFFLSRKTILTLIILIFCAVILGYVFPQASFTDPLQLEKWYDKHPSWQPWVKLLGLDHVHTTPWFALLLILASIALLFSSYEQFQAARKKTFGITGKGLNPGIPFEIQIDHLSNTFRQNGYIRVANDHDSVRFIKHPWGYWGNLLLHLGFVIVIASSLITTLTKKSGQFKLLEGEVYPPGTEWFIEDNGILIEKFVLPDSVSLEKLSVDLWDNNDLKQLTMYMRFINSSGDISKWSLAINDIINYHGFRVFQSDGFGDAFIIDFLDGELKGESLLLHMYAPAQKDRPSYKNFAFEGLPYIFKAKYFADAEKKSLQSTNPLLVMRLVERKSSIDDISVSEKKSIFSSESGLVMNIKETEKVIDEISLKVGESGHFGPYKVRFAEVKKWAGIIFVKHYGMSGIFFGFFIIIAGGMLTYFMPPRDIVATKKGDKFYINWTAARFKDLYEDEFKKVIHELKEKAI